jgi:hypothetical protein
VNAYAPPARITRSTTAAMIIIGLDSDGFSLKAERATADKSHGTQPEASNLSLHVLFPAMAYLERNWAALRSQSRTLPPRSYRCRSSPALMPSSIAAVGA